MASACKCLPQGVFVFGIKVLKMGDEREREKKKETRPKFFSVFISRWHYQCIIFN